MKDEKSFRCKLGMHSWYPVYSNSTDEHGNNIIAEWICCRCWVKKPKTVKELEKKIAELEEIIDIYAA